ncbi:MAG: (Fe-S)-binding protein [Acidobacteria bacterium]|jgi:Fe-S oxidoreductase|nr:(Fe-S)-binding protein [Acidobacteriota bacterium]
MGNETVANSGAEAAKPAAKTQATPKLLPHQILGTSYYLEHPYQGDKVKRFLEIFAAVLKHTNYGHLVDTYARVGAKCANCAVACQIYLATNDPKDIPCYRTNLLLEIYRRHFTFRGVLQSKVTGEVYLTDEKISELAESVYHCTGCRRCSFECPMGIDHGLMTHLSRYILSEMDIAPKALVVATREQLEGKTGNTSAIPVPALLDTLEFLADDIKDEKGIELQFPVDKEGREFVFFPAVSDYLLEAETLKGIALTFYAAGEEDRWTIGTGYYDGINYGLFYSDWCAERIISKEIAETKRLKGRKILIGECGHASRSAKVFVPSFGGGKNALPVMNIMEVTLDMLRRGKLKLDPNVITERVTYHDPCNIARSGWIVDQPREILRAFCKNYVDMEPKGEKNYCCGGGGGTVSIDEVRSYRTGVTGKLKAEQIRRTGAKYVVAPCANCKKQLREVCEDNDLKGVEVVGLHDLIYKALILDNKGGKP